MFIFQKKIKNTGEIHVVVTDEDRVEHLLNGTTWINLNECLNDFNRDPNITEARLTAVYAGDIPKEKIAKYLADHTVPENKNGKQPIAVDSKGKVIKGEPKDNSDDSEDNEEPKEEKTQQKQIADFLEDKDLVCPECGDVDAALVDIHGNIHPCKSCIQIDAYMQGKLKAYKNCSEFVDTNQDDPDFINKLKTYLMERISKDGLED